MKVANNVIAQEELKPETQELYNIRWLSLLAFCSLAQNLRILVRFSNNLGFSSYSPIWANAAIYYGISQNSLQWTSNMYYLTYFALAPFLIPLIEWRLDYSLHLSAILNTVGCWIIWGAGSSYLLTLSGYFLVGCAESIFLALPIYIADMWFSVYERTLAVCISSYMTVLALGFIYPFSSFYFLNITQQSEINDKIVSMNFIIAIISTVSVVLCISCIRNKSKKSTTEHEPIINQIIKLLSTEEILLDIVSFSFIIGVGWMYITIVSLQLGNYGLNQAQIGIAGMLYQLGGVVFGIYASTKLDMQASIGSQPKYDKYIRYTTTCGLLLLIFEAIFIEYFDYYSILIISFLIGIGLNTLYPLVMLAVAEKVFPIRSLIPATMIILISNLIGFILTYVVILPVLLPYSLWISVYMLTPAVLYVWFFYRTKYHKFELDN